MARSQSRKDFKVILVFCVLIHKLFSKAFGVGRHHPLLPWLKAEICSAVGTSPRGCEGMGALLCRATP